MNESVYGDFINGTVFDGKEVDLNDCIRDVLIAQQKLIEFPVDRIIDIISMLADRLLEKSNPIHLQFPGAGIPYLALWCRKGQLEALLDNSLKNRQSLDSFIYHASDTGRSFKAFPRGMVVHWMAGNVPTLGFLSLVMGMLTKNANILKLATGSNAMLPVLLDQLKDIKVSKKYCGSELIKTIAIIRYDHRQKEISSILSSSADVRVIWGSDDSVKSIREHQAKPETIDVVFPNRTSFIIVGEKFLDSAHLGVITKRIAQDVSIFEQKACASPHTIFLLTNDEAKLKIFAESLKNAFESALKTFPKSIPSRKEISAILNLRTQYEMFHEAWCSGGTEYTILSDDLFQIGPPVGNRVVYLRKLNDIEKLAAMITPNVQTVGLAVDQDDFNHITEILGKRGVHRFTNIGTMTHFNLPWDGHFMPQYLIRWTSRSDISIQ